MKFFFQGQIRIYVKLWSEFQSRSVADQKPDIIDILQEYTLLHTNKKTHPNLFIQKRDWKACIQTGRKSRLNFLCKWPHRPPTYTDTFFYFNPWNKDFKTKFYYATIRVLTYLPLQEYTLLHTNKSTHPNLFIQKGIERRVYNSVR